MIVFDVGANKGEFSRHVLENSASACIFAFEPNYEICAKSIEDLIINNPGRIQIFWNALSAVSGKGKLFGSKLMNGQLGSLIPFNHDSDGWKAHKKILEAGSSEEQTVEILSVKELPNLLNFRNIDFLKIDTQGTDLQLLDEFLQWFDVDSGVVEVDVGFLPNQSRYSLSNNDVNLLTKLLLKHDLVISKILPNNSNSDEMNIFFSKSNELFAEITQALNMSTNPSFARFWRVYGVGSTEAETNRVLFGRLLRKILFSFFHPNQSLRSLLLKLTK
jgi:FkbM family methyltransferase